MNQRMFDAARLQRELAELLLMHAGIDSDDDAHELADEAFTALRTVTDRVWSDASAAYDGVSV